MRHDDNTDNDGPAAAEPAVPNDADEFTYPIEGRLTLPDRSPLPTTALSLNGGQYETMTRRDGSCVLSPQ
jgi:hypothetical protein